MRRFYCGSALALILAASSGCRMDGPNDDEMNAKYGHGESRILTDTDGKQYAVEWAFGARYNVRPVGK